MGSWLSSVVFFSLKGAEKNYLSTIDYKAVLPSSNRDRPIITNHDRQNDEVLQRENIFQVRAKMVKLKKQMDLKRNRIIHTYTVYPTVYW